MEGSFNFSNEPPQCELNPAKNKKHTHTHFSSWISERKHKKPGMDSGKTFYIPSKIRTTFPCVVCSAERPLVEEQRRPEQLFGVLAGWQYNSQTVADRGEEKGTTLADRRRQMQSHCYDAMATTTPWLRVYVKSVVFQSPWKPKSGREEARRFKIIKKNPLTCFSLTRTAGKAYIHKMSNLNWIKSKNRFSS